MNRMLQASAILVAAGAVYAQSLDEKINRVVPSAAENRWVNLGWHTNIATALQEAGRQNKPLLLWVMNGNPLGCG